MGQVTGRQESLINRDDERRELQQLLAAGSPKLALLTGRRRVGKTFLLTHTWEADQYFLFTAARTSPEMNRRQLLTDLAGWSGEDIAVEDYPTWRSVFNLLLDLQAPRPLVLILDEFQYLADDEAGLAAVASELNAAWERPRPPRPLLLILAGSAVGTMEALAAGGAPLYGRFAWHYRLKPFSYWHAAQLAPFEALRDRALVYGVFGGTPRYLAAISPMEALEANITRLLLAPQGEVRQLIETALDQEEGLRDVPKYKAILRAVASGCTGRNDIAQRAGLANDTALRDKLARLVALGYLETRRNIDAKPNAPLHYAVADPAFRFHQRFVEPNTSLLEREKPEVVWRELVAPQIPTYMGHEFERIVPQAYERLRSSRSLPTIKEWGRWEGNDRDRRSLEIDVVAPLVKGGTLTGSVKWDHAPISVKVHYDHLGMLERAAHAGLKWAHDALESHAPLLYVAAGGFEAGFVGAAEASGHPTICWSLEDLYAP